MSRASEQSSLWLPQYWPMWFGLALFRAAVRWLTPEEQWHLARVIGGLAFHVVGAPFTAAYLDGHYLVRPGSADGAAETLPVDPGDGGFVELTFSQAGSYPFLTHDMADATLGASGTFTVTG